MGKAEETKARLMSVALAQFDKKGFDETSMRDLAQAADLSLGAFYYHFKSKDDVVQSFYERTFDSFNEGCAEIFAQTLSFEERLSKILHLRLATFEENRDLLIALSRAAVDPRSDLSPFSDRQKDLRERTIAIFKECIETSDLKLSKRLDPYMPTLLWMYLMGVMFFWVYDESAKQKRSSELIDQLTPLLSKLMRLSRLPLSGRVLTPIINLLDSLIQN